MARINKTGEVYGPAELESQAGPRNRKKKKYPILWTFVKIEGS